MTSIEKIKAAWNVAADGFNQWEALSTEEMIEWAFQQGQFAAYDHAIEVCDEHATHGWPKAHAADAADALRAIVEALPT